MPVILAGLVGAYHRPPAKQVLATLPVGTTLLLVAEPENPYDPKAVKVLVDLKEVFPLTRFEELVQALEGTGTEAHELMAAGAGPLQLGYVADSDGKALQKLVVKTGQALVGNREANEALEATSAAEGRKTRSIYQKDLLEVKLQFAVTGDPLVEITWLEGPDQEETSQWHREDLGDPDVGDDLEEGDYS